MVIEEKAIVDVREIMGRARRYVGDSEAIEFLGSVDNVVVKEREEPK